MFEGQQGLLFSSGPALLRSGNVQRVIGTVVRGDGATDDVPARFVNGHIIAVRPYGHTTGIDADVGRVRLVVLVIGIAVSI